MIQTITHLAIKWGTHQEARGTTLGSRSRKMGLYMQKEKKKGKNLNQTKGDNQIVNVSNHHKSIKMDKLARTRIMREFSIGENVHKPPLCFPPLR